MRQVLLFGASGSIGQSSLEILRSYPSDFSLSALSVHRNTDKLGEWIREFSPRAVWISDSDSREEWSQSHPQLASSHLLQTSEEMLDLPADIALNAVMGFAGLRISLLCLERGLDLALANKESLVCGGEFFRERWEASSSKLLPVDSEHSALFQLLEGKDISDVRQLVLTASGGPFRKLSAGEMETVSPEQALNHPTWKMGPKITIDSASLVNKGLELIEAAYLFGFQPDQLAVLVHPESTVHALIELKDSSVFAQMALPDMKQPILQALSWPQRRDSDYGRINLAGPLSLNFEPLDRERFPAVDIAMDALRRGGVAPLCLNAVDEVAVESFLAGEIRFPDISRVIREVLECIDPGSPQSFEDLVKADLFARAQAREWIESRHLAAEGESKC
ncbi:MAG: 1-deoxy-D-xylulose-5-phosphate reductoisomerase [Candidatus Krumholzibacteria bacterium]|jgi:1-deoxy-D-xylulose-5-phosphate reductoisomerase|nr:1-deoxy-D-xylulose-5-phosphate reductoisomerase [Candidatus Krumholzibacteria bacterium]MDP6669016.1 1-deoxy-D-xylulose-5-phosphate reductoisomerase [Candidatus Krumholzibacteria bacterium]MDP6796545.1 1-deoxy-D-xylulose-5-phosphate reductoisomerase [Candidatus Krumholzibacteria bacterium]MDP7021734.1 1-deoxy-D-xylulose-5-phosphate reductoisomerase [Candidatus Krumholzibacteria bacterium]